jgi:hypothetical protein
VLPMIQFGIVPLIDGEKAYQWHRAGAAQNEHILGRSWDDYREMAYEGQIWSACNSAGEYIGLAHCCREPKVWEIGGLMVADAERKSGVGSTLFKLTLGHVLFMEDPLGLGHTVVARVHRQNRQVGTLLERLLCFRHARAIQRLLNENPANVLVEGDEYCLVRPDSLLKLAQWCEGWSGRLSDQRPASIRLPEWVTLQMWASAFRDMAR